jgi:hypothetical protein
MANSVTTFVEKARQEAQASPRHPGEHQANALLDQARHLIYHWPADFHGFACLFRVVRDSQTWEGELLAGDSAHFRLLWDKEPDREMRVWMNYQIGELLAHREAPSRAKMASRSGVLLGNDDPIFGRQVIFPDDPMESYYRIKEGKIRQIARSYPSTRFVINIDSHHHLRGLYAAEAYSAFYWRKDDAAFCKSETYFDDYRELNGVYLPTLRRYSAASSQGLSNREIALFQHRLLKTCPNVAPAPPTGCPFHHKG